MLINKQKIQRTNAHFYFFCDERFNYPMTKRHTLLFLILFVFFLVHEKKAVSQDNPAKATLWADSVMKSLSLEQRIAQLLIIRAWSDRDSVYEDSLTRLVRNYDIGGVCFFKGTPYHQSMLLNRWQQAAQTPLFIATDAEWGAGMRLDSAFAFPKQMTLGAMENDSLIYQMGTVIARDCKRLGIQINFAPVVDINCNPQNPVINVRSFGENKYSVARKGIAYMKGLQDHGIIASAKHFPGHGDTDTDSHLTLPVIRHSAERLDSVELYPFRQLISQGLDAVMIAHLFVPAYETGKNIATTLSPHVATELLRGKLGFKGLVITDALDMQGVTKYFKPGEIEVKAFLAGNDILLLPQNVGIAVKALKTAADSSLIPVEEIDSRCRRILEAKYRAGLSRVKPVETANLYEDLNPESSFELEKMIYRSAVTLVQNKNNLIPLSFLDHRKIATLSIGDTTLTLFQQTLAKYAPADHFNLPAEFSKAQADTLLKKLTAYNLVIIGFHNTSSFPAKQFGLSSQEIRLADTLAGVKKVILDIFGNPYSLALLKHPADYEAILDSYQDVPASEETSACMIFGGYGISGHLPVTASDYFPAGKKIETEATRLSYVLPEEIGIASSSLRAVDSIALKGIESRAYPGCQVLLAKDGKVFYQKAFGHARYEDTTRLTNENIYDLASLTKVLATTLSVMKLYDEGKLGLDDNLGKLLPEARGSNKENLKLRDIMTHQAGLEAWIPFYEKTLKGRRPDPTLYRDKPSEEFPVMVTGSLYLRKDYPDSIIHDILRSGLRSSRDYKYSDLGFYLLRLVVERLSGKPFDQYVSENFYAPLGLTTMGFHPRNRFPVSRITPTEYDTTFRMQQIRGDVHDPGAAMLGGVSGHAGLFSDANDIAIILQMLLNEGSYGGKQYFLPSTVREFTKVQFPQNGNRRGIGFDKPLLHFSEDGPVCKGASPESYGHSGFTGTYFWVDPANRLIYVFLSNRVYPDAHNQRITGMNIRTNIHQAAYDALK